MRLALAELMLDVATRHPELIAMGTDGASAFETIAQRFPDRYVDVGIAEANCIGVAAGLARTGWKVFVTAIASFLVRRASEQIRIDVAEPGLDVTLIGHGAGLSYGTLGSTHHLTEDVALFQSMPNVTVLVPADYREAIEAIEIAAATSGPTYVRLPARVGQHVHSDGDLPSIGSPLVVRSGRDIAIVANGSCVWEALVASDRLAREGVDASVISIPTVSPFDVEGFWAALGPISRIVIVEEHVEMGGLGSRIASTAAGRGFSVATLGIRPRRAPIGDHAELLAFYGIDADAIEATVRRLLAGSQIASDPGLDDHGG